MGGKERPCHFYEAPSSYHTPQKAPLYPCNESFRIANSPTNAIFETEHFLHGKQ